MEERRCGIGLFTITIIVQIVLIVLKLGGALNCGWLVVLVPTWIYLGIIFMVLCLIPLCIILIAFITFIITRG